MEQGGCWGQRLFTISKGKCHGLPCRENCFQQGVSKIANYGIMDHKKCWQTPTVLACVCQCAPAHTHTRCITVCVYAHKHVLCLSSYLHRQIHQTYEQTSLIIYQFNSYPYLINTAIFISSCSLLFWCCSYMGSNLQFAAICCQPNSWERSMFKMTVWLRLPSLFWVELIKKYYTPPSALHMLATPMFHTFGRHVERKLEKYHLYGRVRVGDRRGTAGRGC